MSLRRKIDAGLMFCLAGALGAIFVYAGIDSLGSGRPLDALLNDENARNGLVFGAIGVAMLSGLIIYGIIFIRRKAQIRRLAASGQRITVSSPKAVYNSNVSMNGRSPYNIILEWQNPADTKIYVFKSENIWFDPEKYLPSTITVTIDPANPKIHHVDTSFLPKEA